MRVVVTGGSGLAGRAVVAHLLAHGHDVTDLDLVPGDPHAPFRRVDVGDLGQVYGGLRGAEAVVHLAAIPRPIFDVPEVIFRTNAMGTFNVLEAAAGLGIGRVVYASSMSVLGYPFHERPFAPAYVPIDETHPLLPQDAYALSKHVGEELAAGFARRGRLSVVSLRLAWIHTPETFAEQIKPLLSDAAAGAANLWSYVDTATCGGGPSGADGGDQRSRGVLHRGSGFVHAGSVADAGGRPLPDDGAPRGVRRSRLAPQLGEGGAAARLPRGTHLAIV